MKRKLWSLIAFSIFISCGGGADIGNPDLDVNTRTFQITGIVKNTENKVVSNARVILGKYSDDPLSGKSEDTVISGGFMVIAKRHLFDTVVTDDNGKYKFEQVKGGKCVIVAEKDYYKALLMTIVNYDTDIDLQLSPAVSFTVEPYPALDTTKPHFVESRIAGTSFVARADSNGIIRFTSAPTGVVDIVLFKSDSSHVVYTGLDLHQSITVVQVDPALASQYYTVKSDFRKWNGRPYVLRYGKWSDSLPNNRTKAYDVYVQFSHPMDPYLTSKAMQVSSPDNKIQIEYVDWQGEGLVYLKLCAKDPLGVCDDNLLHSMKNWTVDIDTTAVSLYGIRITWPIELVIRN